MANERLRSGIASAGMTVVDVAEATAVDPKTVERWIRSGRLPHARHRAATAGLLGVQETYLWPQLLDDERTRAASEAELVTLYPQRGAVPADLWRTLIEKVADGLDVLVYAGLFLPDGYPDLSRTLATKARAGVTVRLALGDPQSEAVRLRGEEEGVGEALAGRIRLSATYLAEARSAGGVEMRQHGSTLYNSMFRFDDQLLVNTHVYGAPAARSPVLHLRRVPGGRLFEHYMESFERVWAQARPMLDLPAAEGRDRKAS